MRTAHSHHHHGHFVEALIDWEEHHDTLAAILTLIVGFLFVALILGYATTKIVQPTVAPYTEVYPVYTPYTF